MPKAQAGTQAAPLLRCMVVRVLMASFMSFPALQSARSCPFDVSANLII
jgi:hypothetical protein